MIEDALLVGNDGNDIEQATVLERVAFNVCLMLTNLGVKEVGPLATERLRILGKLSGSKKRIAEAKRQIKAESPTLIRFSQSVDFYDCGRRSCYSGESRCSGGRPKKPHWRKGHFRRQRYGDRLSLSRLQFIKPVFVNHDFFAGDFIDTTIVYQGRTRDVRPAVGGGKMNLAKSGTVFAGETINSLAS